MMKKIKENISLPLCFILILIPVLTFLVGFNISNALSNTQSEEMETIPLYIDVEKQLSSESLQLIGPIIQDYGLAMNNVVNEDFFRGNGVETPDIDLLTSDGKTINLSKINGPIVLEVVADWCKFCREDAALYQKSRIESHPEITHIQYIYTGGEAEMLNFYNTAGIEKPDEVVVVYSRNDFSNWLLDNGFTESFPAFYFFDTDKKVSGVHLGADEPEIYDATLDIALAKNFKTYELKTITGDTMIELCRKIKLAKEYYEETNEIIMPKSKLILETE